MASRCELNRDKMIKQCVRKNLQGGRVASLAQWGERKLLKMLKWAVHVVYAYQEEWVYSSV